MNLPTKKEVKKLLSQYNKLYLYDRTCKFKLNLNLPVELNLTWHADDCSVDYENDFNYKYDDIITKAIEQKVKSNNQYRIFREEILNFWDEVHKFENKYNCQIRLGYKEILFKFNETQISSEKILQNNT